MFYFHTKTDDKQRRKMGEYLLGSCSGCLSEER